MRNEFEVLDRWFAGVSFRQLGLTLRDAEAIAGNCEIAERQKPGRARAEVLAEEIAAYETAIGIDSRLSMGGK